MAFGLSPHYTVELSLENLTREHFLVVMVKAVEQLDWSIRHISENGLVAYTNFSMSSWSEEISVAIEGDHAVLKSECLGTQLMDWGKNKRNMERLETTFAELKTTFTPEELDQKYEELKTTYISDNDETSALPATKKKLGNVFAIFWPAKGYTITPIIIDLNIAIFILMVISGVNFLTPDISDLLKWGANLRSLTLDGEWWRLITNCFLHIGVLHLLFNMYALLYIGLLLEPYLGKIRFLAAYILTGIAASTTSLWMHDQTVSAGASGAIFGMYGVFLAMLTTNFIEKSVRKALLSSIVVFVVYNLANGAKGNIDNAAHIGGLISGFVIGYLYYPSLKRPDAMDLKLGTVSLLAVVILSACFIVYKRTPNNLGEYNAKMKTFASMESMALEIYRMPKNATKDSLLHELKDRGIYYWNQNIELLNEVDKLKLPDQAHERDKILIHYCQLRIKSYNLIYKAIDEDTQKYTDSIQSYNKEIQAQIDSLKVN